MLMNLDKFKADVDLGIASKEEINELKIRQ